MRWKSIGDYLIGAGAGLLIAEATGKEWQWKAGILLLFLGGAQRIFERLGWLRDPPTKEEVEDREAKARRIRERGYVADVLRDLCYEYRNKIDRETGDFFKALQLAMRIQGALDEQAVITAAGSAHIVRPHFDLALPDWNAAIRKAEDAGLDGAPLRALKVKSEELLGIMDGLTRKGHETTYFGTRVAISTPHNLTRESAINCELTFEREAAAIQGRPHGGAKNSR